MLLEIVTVLLLRRDLATATRVGKLLLEAREREFVPCSDYFVEGWATFSGQGKSKLSFTDSAIVSVALKQAEGHVLTFDQEFQKVPGIRAVPK